MKLSNSPLSWQKRAFIMSSIMISSRTLTAFTFTIPRTTSTIFSKRSLPYVLSSSSPSDKLGHTFYSSRLFSNLGDAENEKARLIFLGTPDVAADSLKSIVEASKQDDR